MEQSLTIVCLYSEFSKKCKKIKKMIDNQLNIEYISIDSKDIRDCINNDKKLYIKKVPCILMMYDNGTVEKYEGDKCFQICKTLLKKKEQRQQKEQQELQHKIDIQVQNQLKVLNNKYKQQINDLQNQMKQNEKQIINHYQQKLEEQKNKLLTPRYNQQNALNKTKKDNVDGLNKKQTNVKQNDILNKAKELQKQQTELFVQK